MNNARTTFAAGSRTPTSLTSFIGREHEVAAVHELLNRTEVRRVTVTGPGGGVEARFCQQIVRTLTRRAG